MIVLKNVNLDYQIGLKVKKDNMNTINCKKYYFYIDEGGLFGFCTISIREREIRQDPMKVGLYNYFFGHLPLSSILHHIYLFIEVYPKCTIIFDNESDIKYTKDKLINPGM